MASAVMNHAKAVVIDSAEGIDEKAAVSNLSEGAFDSAHTNFLGTNGMKETDLKDFF